MWWGGERERDEWGGLPELRRGWIAVREQIIETREGEVADKDGREEEREGDGGKSDGELDGKIKDQLLSFSPEANRSNLRAVREGANRRRRRMKMKKMWGGEGRGERRNGIQKYRAEMERRLEKKTVIDKVTFFDKNTKRDGREELRRDNWGIHCRYSRIELRREDRTRYCHLLPLPPPLSSPPSPPPPSLLPCRSWLDENEGPHHRGNCWRSDCDRLQWVDASSCWQHTFRSWKRLKS